MKSETPVLQRIRLLVGGIPFVRLFRNQVGLAEYPDGSKVPYGLAKGSSDLIGWRSIVVTPSMVGRRLAVFVAIEVKSPTGKLEPAQEIFIDNVRQAGGLAGVAYTEQEARGIINSLAGADGI